MRGHRLNIFSDRFKFVGLAVGPHKKFKYCCVVNFAVEYEEKEEEEQVFVDELPPLRGNDWEDDEYDQDEIDEAREWKGPGGFPGLRGPSPNFNQGHNTVKRNQNAPQKVPGPPNNFAFNKKQVNVKSNAPGHRSLGNTNGMKKTYNKINTAKTMDNIQDPIININKKKGYQEAPKCRLINIPMGYDGIEEEEVVVKRKLTIEDYSSDKEIAVQGKMPGNGHKRGMKEEQVENMVGGVMDFKKKKQNTNNMYMKQGVNKDAYIQNVQMKRNRTLSKEKPSDKRYNNERSRNKESVKGGKPYMIPNKGGQYSKSPRRNNKPYQKYNPPKQINMKTAQNPNNQVDLGSDKIKDLRSKQLLEMDDFSMPYNAINCLTKRTVKIQGGQRIKTVRKIFTMKDGTQEIHENNFVERI